jgi:hypothetical protein
MFAFALLAVVGLSPYTAVHGNESPARHFVGSTPCDSLPRRFLDVRPDVPCQRITWQLALATDAATGQPTTFKLFVVYGMQAQSAPGLVDGATSKQLYGTWSIGRGFRSDPNAVVYRLIAEAPLRSAEFVSIGDSILHLLNEDKTLMIGNPSWSYTLNVTNGTASGGGSRRFQPASTGHRTAAGIFEGRTPCQELASHLNVTVRAACNKIKWRLTLRNDPEAGIPATYTLEGFVYRNPPRTGRWAILENLNTGAVIYQLDPDQPRVFLSLHRADKNVLLFLNDAGDPFVGNSQFSFTLNRVADAR